MNEKRTFVCEDCYQEFEADWSEEEAIAEAAKNFPNLDISKAAVVCDNCYNQIMNRISN